ncbi:hypothetical protein B0H11DRAFT_2021582 [Mycena galericulata]|nr:hypothetical protein B0H11DRAFT_2021582 [Mycena galericulata]
MLPRARCALTFPHLTSAQVVRVPSPLRIKGPGVHAFRARCFILWVLLHLPPLAKAKNYYRRCFGWGWDARHELAQSC